MEREGLSKIRLIFEFLYISIYTVLILIRNILRIGFPENPVKLEGHIILVTGGANGIGREICRQLVDREKNLTIIIWDVDEKGTLDTILELRASGLLNAFAFKVDVSDKGQVASAAKTVREEIGDVTILFNNAGISGNLNEGWLESPEITERVFGVNVISHCWTLKEFLPKMIDNGWGYVVETCSLIGFLPVPSSSAYIASKFAMRGYIESVKHDLRLLPSKPRIHLSMVYPNFTYTPMTANVNMSHLRYRFMLNGRTPNYVADKTVHGMLHRKEHIFMSNFDRILIFIVSVLPSECTNLFMDFAGFKSMHSQLMR